MTSEAEFSTQKFRCANFNLSMEADPVGTAGRYDGFLCVEIPGPWPDDIGDSEHLRKIFSLHPGGVGPDGRKWRPQALQPMRTAEPGGAVRVITFERADASRGGPFSRREWLVDDARCAELGSAILSGEPRELEPFAGAEQHADSAVIDLLVCTHGRRDICCGGLGTRQHDGLVERVGGTSGPRFRIWKTSHTGGHRFAPTALSFPDGYAWAHLDADVAEQLINRSGSTSLVVDHCRGNASVTAGVGQAADRAVLAELGWAWASAERTAEVVTFDRRTMASTVRVRGRLSSGAEVERLVDVAVERHIPQITCGVIDAPEFEVEPVLRATAPCAS